MKIIVFADSHGDVITMDEAVRDTKPDMVIHLGDHLKDALELKKLHPDLYMEFVKGNTDTDDVFITQNFISVSDKKIFLTHGDRYGVEYGLDKLLDQGLAIGAEIILFGHTHIPYIDKQKDIWVMNPGRIGRSKSNKTDVTYGVITIKAQKIDCEIINADK